LYVAGNHYSISGTDEDIHDTSGLEKFWTIAGVVSFIGIIFHAVAIYGAMKYSAWCVGAGIFWLVAGLVASIALTFVAAAQFEEDNPSYEVTYNPVAIIIAIVVALLFIYPHVGLIREINNGTMNEQTYNRREEYSCCCV
jgi:heme/copper-type cytochrome/quinol oxidase subunit 2